MRQGTPGIIGAPARLSSQEHFLLPLLKEPCFILAVLLTSQIRVSPGAQVSLADTRFGFFGLLSDAQAPSTRLAATSRKIRLKVMIDGPFC